MKTIKNLSIICLILLTAISLVFSQGLNATPVGVTGRDSVSYVLSDVIGLDMTKYKMDLSSSSVDKPTSYGGLTREDLTYTIESTGSKAQVVFTFVNNTLTRCYIYPLEGSLIYTQSLPSKVLDIAQIVMQRYANYSDSSTTSDLYSILGKLTEIKTMNITSGNLMLQVRDTEGATSLVWWQTINGVEFPLGFSMDFVNGNLKGFSDNTKFYHIGNADVNISREEAISMTKVLAKDSAILKVPNGVDGSYTEVTLNFTDEHMVVELQTANRDPLTLYPLWYVRLSAEQSYGGTDGFQAGIWADTGEIAYAQLTGHHGIVDETPIQSQSTSVATMDWVTPVVISAAVIAVILLATVAFAVKKRR